MTPRRIQRFEVLGELGSGGMGTVYRARDPQLEREVAIKVLARPVPAAIALSPDDTVDLRHAGPGTPDDLLREARMMARLSHPNVLPVYEVGLADGAMFVVMEHIAGSDLARWLAEPRPTAHILAAFAQAAHGLAAAHAHGIIHRDFKPANVLVGLDGRVRVADFGLSRLTAGTTSLVQLDDGHGTPRYMAPELWRGAVASAASDVFALCAALVDALGADHDAPAAVRAQAWRDRKLSPELRAALSLGLSDEPATRPTVDALIALLEPRPAHRRWLAISAVVGVLAIAGGVGAAFAVTPRGGELEAACRADPALFAGRWDAGQRLRLVAGLAASPAGEISAAAAALDGRRTAIEDQLAVGCAAARAGQHVVRDAQIRTSCLERRAFELGGVVDQFTAPVAPAIAHDRRAAVLARDRFDGLPEPADCAAITAPALPADRAPVLALYDRWAASAALGMAASDAPAHAAVLTLLERDAEQLGERELAARVAYRRALSLRLADQLVEADKAAQRAYRAALELHATNLVVNTLLERAAIATLRGDVAAAPQLVQLAQDAAARSTISLATRTHLAVVAGRASIERGDSAAAVPLLEDGLALLAGAGRQLTDDETELRFNLVKAYTNLDGRAADAVRVARDNVAMLARRVGTAAADYGVALNMLAFALRTADNVSEAIGYRRQALAVMQATQPPNSSHIVLQRADVAADLYALGDLEASRKEMAEVMAVIDRNQTLSGSRAELLPLLALATFETGRFDDGLRMIEDAREATLAKFGKAHRTTIEVREIQIDFEHELGQTELAERQHAAIEALYATQHDALHLAVARGGLGSEFATERGRPAAGERASRDALTALDELHAGDGDRAPIYHALGQALLAEHRWADARAALDQALALSRASQQRADTLAVIEIDLARADAGLGRRAAARSRASRARGVLDRFPAQLRARKRAEPLLK